MAEYIYKDSIVLDYSGLAKISPYDFMSIAEYFANQIKIKPAADVVPVVKCKDCKFWDFGDCYRLELSRPDDFCSYGKRKAE